MKASDLRIGNYVEVENYKIIQLDNIHPKGTTKGDEQYLISMLKPIPLTEEWLLKFGFKRHDDGSVSAQFSYGTNPLTQDYLIYLVWFKNCMGNYELKGFPFYQNGHFKIKTVHQLQNLVHSLCGEELELKEQFGKSE